MSAVIFFRAVAPGLVMNAWLSTVPTGSRAWDPGRSRRRASRGVYTDGVAVLMVRGSPARRGVSGPPVPPSVSVPPTVPMLTRLRRTVPDVWPSA